MRSNFAYSETSRKGKLRYPLVAAQNDPVAPSGMPTILHIYLRQHRKRARLSQEHIANILGIAHNTYSEKERGLKPVTLEELENLAKVYGISVAALLSAPEDGPRVEMARKAAQIALTRPIEAAAAWLASGEHIPAESASEKTSR